MFAGGLGFLGSQGQKFHSVELKPKWTLLHGLLV